MKYSRQLLPFLIAATALAAGCDDDGDSTPTPEADMTQPDPDEGVADMDVPDPDMMVNMDMTIDPDMMIDPDMDVVDQMVDQMVDQEVDQMIDASTVIEPGPACVDSAECMGENEQCVDELCRIDFRPDVFRVSEIRVVEPARSSGLLESFLGQALEQNQLNLLVEPGGYTDLNEFLWYIGNGRYYRNDGFYEYIPNTPVQNFFGFWRDAGEGQYWGPMDPVVFNLRVPTGTVEDPDGGPDISCFTQLATTVEITLTPRTNDEGELYMNVQLNGVLTFEDADQVEFPFNGQSFRLTQVLDEEDLNIDLDGDGTADAYPFFFDADATEIVFAGEPPAADGSNRDPAPDVAVDPACEM